MSFEPAKGHFILINKPAGWTSFDVINYIRKIIKKKTTATVDTNHTPTPPKFGLRVGHTGTLDPFATGLLIIGIGRDATKRLDEYKDLPKTYVATLRLGATSDTYDSTGSITTNSNATPPSLEKIESTLQKFLGKLEQLPPMHSAKKVGGVRLYTLARQGEEIERKPHAVEIFEIKRVDYTWPLLTIEVSCSSGTYIRTLAYDIGEHLGTGAYCEKLIRTKIGPYSLDQARDVLSLTLDEIVQ